jgi:(R,R)-butanediol dehydrogenase / meso-butanediol dehydrogenase / diacetyl reductase
VILAGPRGSRIAKAQELGLADCYIFSDSEDVVLRVLNETKGLGANVAVECSGAEQALLNALNAVLPSGRIVLYGLQSAPLSRLDTNIIVLRDLMVFGALSDRLGWERMIELVSTGKLLLAPLITHRFSFREAPDAYEYVRHRPEGLVKAVIIL